MKLGICYMVFDGFELLEYAVKNIRSVVDHISVTYQDISYWGNNAEPELKLTLDNLKSQGLIDEIIFYNTNLKQSPKDNELKLRNIGLQASRNAGCTHHISLDVDEMLTSQQLDYAKKQMEGYDFSIAPYEIYYKHPTYLITPCQNLIITLIHPVENEYRISKEFPYLIEMTRRLTKWDNCKIFSKEEIIVHHMSCVRKDIRRKFANNDNKNFYNLREFYRTFDNYKLGELVALLPDYRNRRTVQVENLFGIDI